MPKNKTIVPYAFIISLVVIVTIETISYSNNRSGKLNLLYNRFYSNNNQVPPIDQSIIQWQIFNIRTNIKKQQDILFFGDSSCLMGIRPHVFMEETDLTAWNIGLIGTLGVEGHAEALDFYLQYHSPPKLAVYHISHYPLELSNEVLEGMSMLRILKKWLSSISLEINPFQLQSPILLNILKVYMLETWSDVLDQPRGIFASDNEFRSILAESRGFLELPRHQPLISESPGNLQLDFTTNFDPDNSNNLKIIFDISKKYNFAILVVFNPIHASYETENTIESFAHVKEKIKEAATSYSNVYIEDEPVRFFPDHICGSITHLYIEGATKNTKDLIPVMQDILKKSAQ